ncbi:MAG: hypothetical protein ACRBN8_06185 [Nannocystales bacterium]
MLELLVDEAESLESPESSSVELDELELDDEPLDDASLDELEPDDEPDDVMAPVVPVDDVSPMVWSGATNPVVGPSVSTKNGLSSMHAGRSTRPKISRFIRISLSRQRWSAR